MHRSSTQDRFNIGVLRHKLVKNGGKLFPSREFLQSYLNYGTANLLTLTKGLAYVIARGIRVDQRDMTARKNVKKWH